MEVKKLIQMLLEMSMDAKVLISEKMHGNENVEEEDWCTKEANFIVDYEDGYIGIVAIGERMVD